eukprot:TRINITY_DN40869_c0_g1_i1.p2 TRINITY_DN40869_c0_g1~~TRINITY_DN40869_c0_g1_i1.p2  ORF type:complete len:189 (+),score=53.78 TRINITY_DN40869_c0_g1_i1:66-632(+)
MCIRDRCSIDIDLSASDRRWERSVDSIVQELEGTQPTAVRPRPKQEPSWWESSLLEPGQSSEEQAEPETPRERKWVNIWEQAVCCKPVEQLEKEWGAVGARLGIQVWRIDNRWNTDAPAFRVQQCSTSRAHLHCNASVLLLRTHRPRRDGWCKVKLGAGSRHSERPTLGHETVSYTHLTLPTKRIVES